ncbi:MAG: HypC/HybG/HupF family hydrogenase formation chaperone [Verrucomicrobiota bacterium]|nr:HypC/HybG/HupF family hydrogenase formation chaperone [Verrucomicrobiota bacterium]
MCLAIPGKILSTHREHEMLMAKVEFGGIIKRICLEYVPEAQVGDYVLVHVGFALARVDEEEAKRIYQMLEQMGGLEELNEPPEPERPRSETLWRKVEPSGFR